ncbi:TIGR03943 family putative permease subunit [Streptomyces sp. NBC_00670]|uniref:TIGR03943 family putative permease subunit n=1 Tax=Streptomyces sp. NBC_00670 TaxID=2975804 RepID=UPI002E302048|nr:TIGR03943 family protein [Streptomyces sp. NBC_00670]
MNRHAQAVVLFLTGTALLHAGLTDLYLRYVKAGLRPLLLAAGAVLIVTAAATAWYDLRRARAARRDRAEQREAGHVHREPWVSWLLVLPLLALILLAPPALGSYSAMRTGTALQAPFGYPPLPAGNPVPLDLVDYAGRAAYGHGRGLGDRKVRITGFVALDGAGRPYLVRMALSCCAADAQPVKVGLTGRVPPVLQPDSWLTVVGTYTPEHAEDPVNGRRIPYLDVSLATVVPVPHDPYDESWNT